MNSSNFLKAAPLSISSSAIRTPFSIDSALPAIYRAASCIEADCLTLRSPFFTFQNLLCNLCIFCRCTTYQIIFTASLISKLLRRDLIRLEPAILDLAYRSWGTHRNLIQFILSENNHSFCHAKLCHNLLQVALQASDQTHP